jgi:hypothetical protein
MGFNSAFKGLITPERIMTETFLDHKTTEHGKSLLLGNDAALGSKPFPTIRRIVVPWSSTL